MGALLFGEPGVNFGASETPLTAHLEAGKTALVEHVVDGGSVQLEHVLSCRAVSRSSIMGAIASVLVA